MTAKQLIDRLSEMPPDAEVTHLWDGAPRTNIEVVYLSRRGEVITSDFRQVAYNTQDRPEGSPTSEQERFWETEKDPSEESE